MSSRALKKLLKTDLPDPVIPSGDDELSADDSEILNPKKQLNRFDLVINKNS